MKAPLRILHLEDEASDAELIQVALRTEGMDFEIELVQTAESFTESISRGKIDLVLSDLSLPGFDGMAALEILHERAPEVPFIFVSGTLGEEAAIDCLRNGATD